MSAQENLAVARGWALAAFNQHDLDAAARFLATDWVGHWVGMPEAHGHDGFKRLAGAYLTAFPDMQISVEDAIEVGDRVVRRVSWLGTHQGPFLGVSPTRSVPYHPSHPIVSQSRRHLARTSRSRLPA